MSRKKQLSDIGNTDMEFIVSHPLPIEELLFRHLAQEDEQKELERKLQQLHEDALQTNKLIFDYLQTIPKHVKIVAEYKLALETTRQVIPSKTTYKYKEILADIRDNYIFPSRWLNKIYDRYKTVSKKQIQKTTSLIITPLNNYKTK